MRALDQIQYFQLLPLMEAAQDRDMPHRPQMENPAVLVVAQEEVLLAQVVLAILLAQAQHRAAMEDQLAGKVVPLAVVALPLWVVMDRLAEVKLAAQAALARHLLFLVRLSLMLVVAVVDQATQVERAAQAVQAAVGLEVIPQQPDREPLTPEEAAAVAAR